jgi:hypothetical protein
MDSVLQGYVEAALSELGRSSMHDIQLQTALVWYGRAIAAIKLGRPEDAREFAHESIEHAALSGNMRLVAELHQRFAANGLI